MDDDSRMPADPLLLVDLIYRDSKRRNLLLPQITRLTKLMYLAEVEYFRQKRERLTDLKWIFYLFGPYPLALKRVLGEPEIETNEWRTGKTSRHIVREESAFMGAKADFDLEALVDRIVREWGDADLNQLLDYVYFETEPMQNVKRGDLLDFATVAPAIPKRIQINLDREKLRELSRKITARAKDYAPLRQAEAGAPDLSENLAIWDKEEKTRFPSGPCKIRLSDLVPRG
jgi:Protein of unknown function (DUF4065)